MHISIVYCPQHCRQHRIVVKKVLLKKRTPRLVETSQYANEKKASGIYYTLRFIPLLLHDGGPLAR